MLRFRPSASPLGRPLLARPLRPLARPPPLRPARAPPARALGSRRPSAWTLLWLLNPFSKYSPARLLALTSPFRAAVLFFGGAAVVVFVAAPLLVMLLPPIALAGLLYMRRLRRARDSLLARNLEDILSGRHQRMSELLRATGSRPDASTRQVVGRAVFNALEDDAGDLRDRLGLYVPVDELRVGAVEAEHVQTVVTGGTARRVTTLQLPLLADGQAVAVVEATVLGAGAADDTVRIEVTAPRRPTR
ncbi:uncharacterized protein V1510DRAFT_427686 [Dipodascopsis tothii]|uniref:uncharacterized protein n=1 Tax=Dipodascopsis tothii TaxID=44089 RepID=UPI0034CF3B2A